MQKSHSPTLSRSARLDTEQNSWLVWKCVYHSENSVHSSNTKSSCIKILYLGIKEFFVDITSFFLRRESFLTQLIYSVATAVMTSRATSITAVVVKWRPKSRCAGAGVWNEKLIHKKNVQKAEKIMNFSKPELMPYLQDHLSWFFSLLFIVNC